MRKSFAIAAILAVLVVGAYFYLLKGKKPETGNSIEITLHHEDLPSMGEIPRFLKEAKMESVISKEGKLQGFRVTHVMSGSIYEKFGLAEGDVLVKANNIALNDPSKLIEVYNSLKTSEHPQLTIDRSGQLKTYTYTIK
jgi:general secretion pathway protein C